MAPTLILLNNLQSINKDKRRIALYLCSCGRTTIKPISRVLDGTVKTCGNKIHRVGINANHGMSGSAEYTAWKGIKSRVFNPRNKNYKQYSMLGMSDILANDFMAFYKEIGKKPSNKHSVDRINNNVGYFEGNIRWATKEEQGRNKKSSYRIIIDGLKFDTLKTAADKFGVSIITITRWCDGYIDNRRINQKTMGKIKPRKGCYRELYYT